MRASHIMTTPVVTVPRTASVGEAARLMLHHRVSGLPVVDAAGDLVGMITEGDLLRRSETAAEPQRPRWLQILFGQGQLAAEYVHAHSRRIDDVMTRDVATVPADTPVERIAELMETRRIKRVPVVHGRRVVGIVSRANLLHALASAPDRVPDAAPAALALRDRVLREFAAQPWMPALPLNVVVWDGVVHLWGSVSDERQRAAMRVAAENVPGVRGVEDHLVRVDSVVGLAL